jgi:predicted amidohydrolase
VSAGDTPMSLRIGLASPHFPASTDDAVRRAREFLAEAAERAVDLVCFPECYLPGMRGQDFDVAAPDQHGQAAALEAIRAAAATHGVAVIMPMEWESADGFQNVAFVISAAGEVLGYQTKNQIPIEEEPYFQPGSTRRVFTVRGVPFGVAICHEGWRYPETVRWAALRGAKIVFHPHYAGGAEPRAHPARWGAPESPFYEKAMIARGAENAIYFASVNYALPRQDAATTLIGPAGECLAHAAYGEESLLVYDVDPQLATGFLAARYQPSRYQDASAPA